MCVVVCCMSLLSAIRDVLLGVAQCALLVVVVGFVAYCLLCVMLVFVAWCVLCVVSCRLLFVVGWLFVLRRVLLFVGNWSLSVARCSCVLCIVAC